MRSVQSASGDRCLRWPWSCPGLEGVEERGCEAGADDESRCFPSPGETGGRNSVVRSGFQTQERRARCWLLEAARGVELGRDENGPSRSYICKAIAVAASDGRLNRAGRGTMGEMGSNWCGRGGVEDDAKKGTKSGVKVPYIHAICFWANRERCQSSECTLCACRNRKQSLLEAPQHWTDIPFSHPSFPYVMSLLHCRFHWTVVAPEPRDGRHAARC